MTGSDVRLFALRLAFVVTALTAALSSLGLALAAWAAIASDGEADPEFSWGTYFALVGAMAGVAVVAGGAALILNRRLNMVEGHIVGKAAASPKPLPPPDQT